MFVAVFSPPIEAQEHNIILEVQDFGLGHLGGADHRHGDDEPAGHCHPGLDCSLVAAFPLSLQISPFSMAGGRIHRSVSRELIAWVHPLETPPPRNLS